MLSESEKQQFSRQIRLPGFGEEKQLLLKNTHVMVIGVGGLGNSAAQYLAAAGIGRLTLVDFDRIEFHNLHRQPLFGVNDVGAYKAETAARKLRENYPALDIEFALSRFEADGIPEFPSDIKLIADCTDNFSARYDIDTFASSHRIPVLFGAIHRYEGRLALFNGLKGIRYKDAYPHPPISNHIRHCEEEGVLGPLAGLMGCMMTTAIIEFLTSGTSNVDGAMLHFDASTFKTSLFEIASTLKTQVKTPIITSLNASPSNAQLVKSGFYELIDVREWHEHEELNIGGKCLPAGNVREWENQLDLNVSYLLYCSHGYQSSIVAQYISARFPQIKIAHLHGGLEAWHDLIKE